MQSNVMRAFNFVWSWTFGGLPYWLTLPGAKATWSKTLVVDSLEDIKKQTSPGDIIDVLLSTASFHMKELSFPKSAAKNLTQVVDLHVTQSFPQRAKNLVWNFSETKRDKSTIHLAIHLVKRTKLKEIIDHAQELEVQVRSISSQHTATSLILYDGKKHTDRARRFWNVALIVAIIFALLLVVQNEKSQIDHKAEQIESLEHAVAQLRKDALELRERAQFNQEQENQVKSDLAYFRSEYQRLPIFIGLSKLLSDETWVSELSIENNTAYLSILSTSDVAKILQSVQTLDWVKNVELEGPVSFDRRSRRNRFEIRTEMTEDIGAGNE